MLLVNSKGKLIFLAFACQLALLVIIFPLHAGNSTPAKQKSGKPAQVRTSSLKKKPAGTIGIARYYAKRFDGRRTASGVIYNPQKLTAAHPTLPFGTQVKVVNLSNKKSVIVTVNDRCLEHEASFIDLSRQAAHQLNFIRKGRANVRIIPILNRQ